MNINTIEVMNTLCYSWHGNGWFYKETIWDWSNNTSTVICEANLDLFVHSLF